MKTFGILAAGLLVTVGTWTASARAADQPIEFLHALQSRDYGDIAIDYLKMLQEKGNMPDSVREVWDLEMSRSLRASASQAFDEKDYNRLMDEAQNHLNKFLKEKPEHPEAMSAMVSWGNFTVDRGKNLLGAALSSKEPGQRTAQLELARAAFADARPKFEKAIPKLQARLAALPPAPNSLRTREEREAMRVRDTAENAWLEARFQLAMCDYYTAQTYEVDRKKVGKPPATSKAKTGAKPEEQPQGPAKPSNEQIFESLLKKAAAAFDAIYQTNRVDRFGRVNLVGLYAHMWHGRVADEMGDDTLALDIYDEVLVNYDPSGGMEDLFTQVEYFRMQIVAKRSSVQEYLTEATEWLRTNERTARGTDGYQGIAVDVAKKCLEVAEKVPDKTPYLNQARRLLGDSVRIRSSHQAEAIMLRRKITGTDTDVSKVATFDEAVAIGDTAIQGEQWKDAVAAYARAMELSERVTDQDRLKTVKDRYGVARLKLALENFNEGKAAEAYAEAGKLVSEYEGSALAPSAASLAVQSALRMFATSGPQERNAALERVEKVAQFIEEKWGSKPEADDARVARGQTALVRGDLQEAINTFEKVNPKSERYSVALHWAGISYWRRALMERQKPENQRNKEQADSDRAKAAEAFQKSLQMQTKALEAGKPLPQQIIDTQLALGEIRLDEGKPEEAVKLFAPLVEAKKSTKAAEGESVDTTTLRIFVGAVQAYTALNDFDQAAAVGQLLLEMGPDMEPINRVLVEFAKLVHVEWQKADAAATAAKDEKEKAAAEKKRTDVAKMLGHLLQQLAGRQNNTPAGMVYIADRCAEIGMDKEAKEQYERIVKRTESDASFAAAAAKAMTRVRAQLIGLLRKEGNNEEALTQVEELVKDNPRSLEPLMERGRILVALGDQKAESGDAAKAGASFEEALKRWVWLRNGLSRAQGKKPPELYEATYFAAYSSYKVAVAKKASDATESEKFATDAEKLLKSTLILSPTLGDTGENMIAKYNKLIEEIGKFLGR